MRPVNNGPMSGAVARPGGSFFGRQDRRRHKNINNVASLVKLSSIPLDQRIQLFIDS